ncbi:MAG: carboxypeptidase regulatory-like domain-containing protein [Gemmatimonadaceae bacterium]
MLCLGRPFLAVALLARVAAAQVDSPSRVVGTTVSGVVRDSIARVPLAGAMVELVAADSPARFARTAMTDAQGRYMLKDVPDGHHMLGFFHPLLDSIGVDAPLREVFVAESRPVYADLAIPSAKRIRTAICGHQPWADSGAVIVGIVRNATNGSPAAEATVMAEWVELSLRRDGLVSRHVPRRVAKTSDNGWFAMCNVPNAGTIALVASLGADSTDMVEVRAPADGFMRHELFLGANTEKVSAVPSPGNSKKSAHRVRTGAGHLSGVVVASSDQTPLVGALVSINDGPEARTNEFGEWTIVDAPVGSRMIEVRALGYAPSRRSVDIIEGAPKVRVALSTMQSILDTVKVVATRMNNRDGDGFDRRRKSSIGRFLTAADVARFKPLSTSDIFHRVPGVVLDYDTTGVEKQLLIRGGTGGKCAPALFINGLPMTSRTADGGDAVSITADDLDTWIRPADVIGIEVYTGETAPIEFQQALSGCGSVLIWTKLGR